MIKLITSWVLYTQLIWNAQPGSDLLSKLYVLVHSSAAYKNAKLPPQAKCYKLVHLFATYALMLHVLQRCRAISKSYKLQTRLVHPCATYALTLYFLACFLRSIKDAEPLS